MPGDGDHGPGAGTPPDWLPLASDEAVQWAGGPRLRTILPFVALGLVAVLAGLGLFWGWRMAIGSVSPVLPVLAALAVASGLAVPGWAYLHVTNTEYVVTDRYLYRKSGILGRRVTIVGYETVQNVAYAQGITGKLFDHGTVSFDTAGGSGTELAFSNVDDPRALQRLVEERRRRFGRGDGFGGGRGSGPESDGERTLPGTTAQWAAVRDEVVALRRAIEGRRE